jgi:hypothetical protein
MSNIEETKIRSAWERYHGPPLPGDDEIPQAPPAYERGYRDGYAEAIARLKAVKDADIDHYMNNGCFALPESVRVAISEAIG